VAVLTGAEIPLFLLWGLRRNRELWNSRITSIPASIGLLSRLQYMCVYELCNFFNTGFAGASPKSLTP
jgi:hypothetical protein